MKTQLKLLFASGLCAVPVAANADVMTYVEGSVGGAFISDVTTDIVDPPSATGLRASLDYDPSITAGAEFGAAGLVDGRLRVGVSYDYIDAELDKVSASGTLIGIPITGSVDAETLESAGYDVDSSLHIAQVQAYYNLPPVGTWMRPYVGAGLGAAFVDRFDPELAFSVTAGSRFDVGSNTYLGLRYRFHYISGPTDDRAGIELDSITAHTVSAVLGVYFN